MRRVFGLRGGGDEGGSGDEGVGCGAEADVVGTRAAGCAPDSCRH